MDNEKKEQNNNMTGEKHGTAQKRKAFPRKKKYVVALLILALVTAAFFIVLILADLLPSDLTVILAVAVTALLLLTNFMFSSRYKWKRIVGIVIAGVLIFVLASVTVFMGETYAMLNSISGGGGTADASGPVAEKVSVAEEPFNIYITGIDQWESEKGLDLERSDVNMIVTVNPVTKKVLLTSIPRDSYVKLHTAQQMDKLTHTGIYGVDETIYTVEDWLGIDLNYYVKMNFSAAVEIIDALGGIKVYSPVAFDSSLRGYHYRKGWNYLGGYRALFFARERHAFEGQDSIRVENQQRVVQAIIKKMTSSTALLSNYGDVMSAASRNMRTNMASYEMTELAKMQLTDLGEWDIKSQKIEGEYGEDYVASLTQRQKFSVYITDPASEKACVKAINKVMNPSVRELEEARQNTRKGFILNALHRVNSRIHEKEESSGKK